MKLRSAYESRLERKARRKRKLFAALARSPAKTAISRGVDAAPKPKTPAPGQPRQLSLSDRRLDVETGRSVKLGEKVPPASPLRDHNDNSGTEAAWLVCPAAGDRALPHFSAQLQIALAVLQTMIPSPLSPASLEQHRC